MAFEDSGKKCYKFAVALYPPHVEISGKKPPYKISGNLISFFDIIAETLGICYEIVVPTSGNYGTRLPNGTWDGIIGMMNRSEADLCSQAAVTPETYEAMDYSEFLYADDVAACFKTPKLEPDLAGFVKPYTGLMWLMIIASTFVMFLTGCAIFFQRERASEERSSASAHDGVPGNRMTLSRSAEKTSTWIISALLAQSLPTELRGGFERVLWALWLFVTLILGTVYRSNLKAMLILPRVTVPFDSLEELVQLGIPTNIMSGTRLFRDIMNAPANSTLGKLSKQVEPVNGESIIKKTLLGTHVAMGPRTSYYWASHNLFSATGTCPLQLMRGNAIVSTWYSLGFPRGSKLKEKVNTIIRRVRYSGIWDHLFRKSVPKAYVCLKPLESGLSLTSERPLSFMDFAGVFCVYLAGILASVLAFLIEVTVTRLG